MSSHDAPRFWLAASQSVSHSAGDCTTERRWEGEQRPAEVPCGPEDLVGAQLLPKAPCALEHAAAPSAACTRRTRGAPPIPCRAAPAPPPRCRWALRLLTPPGPRGAAAAAASLSRASPRASPTTAADARAPRPQAPWQYRRHGRSPWSRPHRICTSGLSTCPLSMRLHTRSRSRSRKCSRKCWRLWA
jgi:hypothetical protein